jgi:hypothetical protein
MGGNWVGAGRNKHLRDKYQGTSNHTTHVKYNASMFKILRILRNALVCFSMDHVSSFGLPRSEISGRFPKRESPKEFADPPQIDL